MKEDILNLCLKLCLCVAPVGACMLWGFVWVPYAVLLLLLTWLFLYLYNLCPRIRHTYTYTRPLRRFCHAVKHHDAASFEKLLQQHMPVWRCGENDALSEAVFSEIVRADSFPFMRMLLQQEPAPWWQEHLSTADLLCSVVLHGSPQMLHFLIEQGMRPEAEWESPWLIARINGRSDHARILLSLNAAPITPEQQERSAWLPFADRPDEIQPR